MIKVHIRHMDQSGIGKLIGEFKPSEIIELVEVFKLYGSYGYFEGISGEEFKFCGAQYYVNENCFEIIVENREEE